MGSNSNSSEGCTTYTNDIKSPSILYSTCIGTPIHELLYSSNGDLTPQSVRQSEFLHDACQLGLFASCFVAVVICVLSQLAAGFRLKSENKALNERRRLITDIIAARQAAAHPTGGARVHGQPTQHILNLERQQAQLSKRPMTGTILFAFQSLLSAIIMLIIMTFNGFLIVSCVLGSGIGYHYFGKTTEALCH